MIGKAWLLDSYHEWYSEYFNYPLLYTGKTMEVTVLKEYKDNWTIEFPESYQHGTGANVPKRFIEFIPPYMLESDE